MEASAGADADGLLAADRRRLVSLAFRLLGTVAEAEDAVQEAYLRWYRMGEEERSRIEAPPAWFTRVVSRICLDVLGSARARRERYVGPWLPEPIPALALSEPAASDPLDQIVLDDSVSTALLLVLESMTPAERVVFVLHDVFALPFAEVAEVVGRSPGACRQLAVSARARIDAAPLRRTSRAEHDRVVRAFSAAARSGELAGLVAVLDPAVVLVSDGGGRVTSARNPVRGADRVGRFLLGAYDPVRRGVELVERETGDGLGLVIRSGRRTVGVITLAVRGGVIADVRIMRNPEKLSFWD